MKSESGSTTGATGVEAETLVYSDRHKDPEEALRYRGKFDRSLLRRLSSTREARLVLQAFEEAVKRLPPVLPGRDGITLLDYPCGAGRFAGMLAERVGQYVAADNSESMLALCTERLESLGLAAKLRGSFACDARDMTLETQSVDLACCMRLLHHFRDPVERAAILRGFRRVNRGPLVASYLDAESVKQWLHARRLALRQLPNRRAILSAEQIAEEAHDAGYHFIRRWQLSSLFSGQCIALFEPIAPDAGVPQG